MDAPILQALRERMASTADEATRSVLELRQALYLARTARIEEAAAVPARVREAWAGREDLQVFVWLWLVEGVLAFYRTSRADDRQRLLQAHAAADKAGLAAEAQLAAAWLGHLAYVCADYGAMVRWLKASGLGLAQLEETQARGLLTLACALQWFGHDAEASRWFARAREVARRSGDRAGIMASGANRCLLRLNDNWLDFCFGEPLRHDLPSLRQELMGILGYEQLSGSESLQEQNEVARLRLALLQGDHAGVLAQSRDMSAATQRRSAAALAMAETASRWVQGQPDAALAAQHFQAWEASFRPEELDDDDVAACRHLMASLAERAGATNAAARLRSQAIAARERIALSLAAAGPALLALQAEAELSWPQT
jgi:hypothetical protein